MPIKDIFLLNPNLQIGVWEITESIDELLESLNLAEEEFHVFNLFKNERRKKEWLAIRCLLQKMDKSALIIYLKNGKPRLKAENGFISLSHTKGWVSIILNKSHDVGCDIEQLTPEVLRIKEKFASDEELEKSENHKNKLAYFTLLWSTKEAIYKLFSEIVALEFKTQIKVEFPAIIKPKGNLKANVIFNGKQKIIELDYHLQPEYALVYSMND